MASLKKYHTKGKVEAGCDEAGRGCLAGPVVAAAVILPVNFNHKDLNDSKQLSERKRNELRPIIEAEAISWAVGIVSVNEIDEVNILNASFLAMHRAIDQLRTRPEVLLIDGNRFNAYAGIDHRCIIQGDAIYRSIAAASVLAKTYRDESWTGCTVISRTIYGLKTKDILRLRIEMPSDSMVQVFTIEQPLPCYPDSCAFPFRER